MADYNISAQITADTKGFESGVKKAQSASKKLGKSITDVVKGFGKSGLSGAITSAGLALGGIGLAVGTAVKAIKGITKALGECAEAYKVQLQAERALDTAISNSPYVSGTASKALKDFASEMQKVSNLGDEEIIPQMTQLVATGRTEAEVMKIIATASDMSASGAMSFDQAVTQLNATLNGNIGRLGQQNAELKGLTEEELKSGKAVEILGEKYKGLAQATVDTKKQLQNAIGDLKETFGSVFEKAMTPMRKFFTDLIQGWADARKAKQEYENSMVAIEKGEATANDYRVKEKKLLEEIEAIEGDLRKQAEELGMTYEEAYNLMADWQRAQLEAMKEDLDNTRLLAKMHEGLEKIKQKEAEWAQEEAEKRQAEIDKETKIADLKTEYLKKIAEQEAKWEHIKEVTGEQVTNEEKIAFYQDSLVDLMTQAGGQITTNNQLYKDQVKIIEQLQAGLQPEEKKTGNEWEKKLREQMIARLEAEKEAYLESEEYAEKTSWEKYQIERNYNERLKALELERLEEEKAEALSSVENFENAEEEKARIREYYNKEMLDVTNKYSTAYRYNMEEVYEGYAEGFKGVLQQTMKNFKTEMAIAKENIEKVKKSLDKVGKVLSSIGNIAKSMFQGGVSIFSKLFNIDVDSALDSILKIEDKILTFFVETVPKLPAFFKSALQSISVLLSNIRLQIDAKKVKDFVAGFIKTLMQTLPQIVKTGAEIVKELLLGMIQGIGENSSAIFDLLITIAKEVIKMLPDILIAIIKAIPSILKSLAGAIGELVGEIAKFVANMVIDGINLLLDGISKLWTWLPNTKGIPHIPHFEAGTNNASKGLALVGEAGPELIDFKGGERVYNNRNTQKMIAGAGAGNIWNVTFNNLRDTSAYAMMSQLRAYNRQLSINGVI